MALRMGVVVLTAVRRQRATGYAGGVALRSIWNGTIAFAGVFVPVKVHSATENQTVHFHEVHVDDGARIEHKRICPKEDKEVPYKEIVKGYEVSEGKYVVLEKEELDAAAGEEGRLIEIEDFVCAGDIDPVNFDKTYYLGARTRARMRTGCCTTRSRSPTARASAAGSSTTASTSSRSARSTA